jgi:nucleoside-diphosphate-sugar epimerase
MNVFIAGGTGVVGRRALKLLVAAGHTVTALARSPGSAELVERLGATPVTVDLFDSEAVRRAVEGHDAVVNIATKIPSMARAGLPGVWRENNRIRSTGARNLVDAALAAGATRYVQESFAPAYPDRGDEWIDENVRLEPSPYARTVLDAEREAGRFTDSGGMGVVLRFGLFYGPDGTHAESTFKAARRGFAAVIGPPDAFLSSITTDDAASAVLAALGAPAGTYNVVDDEPLMRKDFVQALANALGRDRLRTVPASMVRLGGSKVEMLMRSQRISNRRFRDAAKWAPAYPSGREGWPAIVAEHAKK